MPGRILSHRIPIHAAGQKYKPGLQTLLFTIAIGLASVAARAEPQTVTLHLPTMNCAMCPITVKKALTGVEGVSKAEVSYDKKTAVVTFEDSKTGAGKLVEATTNAGYPSTVKE
jgi:mercuric ion binding protein